VLQFDGVEAIALDGLDPLRTLEITAGLAQALECKRERDALDVELELPTSNEPTDNLG
jgi:hypothetical protein